MASSEDDDTCNAADGGDEEEEEEEEPLMYTVPAHLRDEDDDEIEEWSVGHAKLLYMLSMYAKCAQNADEKESWVREMPVTVLLFEGITAGVLDYDYAPNSRLVTAGGRSRRVWLNVSQEGRAAVDDLRERHLINGLKLSTEDFQPVTAYQVSAKGLDFLDKICPPDVKAEVDGFIFHENEQLKVSYAEEEEVFKLRTDSGSMEKVSDVTETEDVSYVSSPYLPKCLRAKVGRVKPFTSNHHRAYESAAGGSNIADELDEAVVLGMVHAMVGEWIPFGSNQIVALNERLGALDRCQGGLFTAMVDKSPTDTQFAVPPGLTQVTILDYDFVRFINFEAEINYPEDEGIVQVENFGMHLNVDGTIIYGVKIEAIIDRGEDDISIDHLSRLLVDVHQDSSSIMNDLLSQYQRSLLDMIFIGDAQMRNKYNCILAEEIKPKMAAEEYMDKGDFENELKQVLGDIRASHDLGEIFIRNFFVRTFVLDDSLNKIRNLIMTYQTDPNNIVRIRSRLNDASRDIILLKEVLEYLRESLQEMIVEGMPADHSGKRLYKVLDVPTMRGEVMLRCADLNKLVAGAHHQLITLQQMTDVINTKQLEDVFKNVEANTRFLVDASAASERSSASLEVMQVILAGSFAFDIVDRLSGGTLNIVIPKWTEDYIVKYFIDPPMLWFAINMLWFLGISMVLMRIMKKLNESSLGALSLRVKVNRKVNLLKLRAFLKSRSVDVTDTVCEESDKLVKMTWTETDTKRWHGGTPTIEILYDDTYNFLLSAYFQIDAKVCKLREEGLQQVFNDILKEAGVYGEFDKKMDGASKRMSVIGGMEADAVHKAAAIAKENGGG